MERETAKKQANTVGRAGHDPATYGLKGRTVIRRRDSVKQLRSGTATASREPTVHSDSPDSRNRRHFHRPTWLRDATASAPAWAWPYLYALAGVGFDPRGSR